MYNPKADIFTVMRKFDRPMNLPQLSKAMPAIPKGTISSTLNTFMKEGVAEMIPTKGKAHDFRLIVKELPQKFTVARLNGPVQRGLKRERGGKKPEAVLLMIPLPKGESAVVTVEEAKRIYEALKPFFKE